MLNKDYIAGFFDGEGCINISIFGKNHQCGLRIMIVNTDRAILEELKGVIGGNIHAKEWKNGWKTTYQLQLHFNAAKNFILEYGPLLKVKKAQADLALMFIRYMETINRKTITLLPVGNKRSGTRPLKKRTAEAVAKEKEFKEKMHALNKKGEAA